MEENPEFSAVDPALLDVNEEDRVRVSDYGRVVIPSRKELAEKTRSLDKDQRKVVDLAVKQARGILKARKRGRAPPEPQHLMVHGTAGTGESYIMSASNMVISKYLTICKTKISRQFST